MSSVVEDVLRGYNGTIMAYGQTGAGKTYTLSSIQPDAIGMIPRAAAEVFASIAGDPANEYSVFMSYIQIYMELIQVIVSFQAIAQAIHSQGGECSVFFSHVQNYSKLKQAGKGAPSGMHQV